MANVKISDLTAAASALGTQEFEVNESGTSKKVTGAQIATYVEGVVSSDPTFTGQVSIADGSNTAPSLTNTGDTNTGVYFPASDEVAIATGGTKRFSVDANGVTNVDDLKVAGNNVATAGSFSNRNKIINGNFDIWQRGTSGSGGYLADRWRTLIIGSSAAISRQAFTLGQTDVPNEPEYFHRVVATSVAGAGNLVVLQQRVEFVRTFAGQTVTLSFWAKADAGKDIAVEFSQDFGVGGSSAVTAIGVTTCTLTTSWQKFTVTASISSISGKTIGSQSSIDLTFWFDAGSNFNSRSDSLGQQSGTFDIAQVQLEAGDVATPFEVRSYGQELALCQRYFRKGSVYGWGYAGGGGPNRAAVERFGTPMRVVPAITLFNQSYVNASALATDGIQVAGFGASVNATGVGGYIVNADYTADAEL